jgi:hypothetical protein
VTRTDSEAEETSDFKKLCSIIIGIPYYVTALPIRKYVVDYMGAASLYSRLHRCQRPVQLHSLAGRLRR